MMSDLIRMSVFCDMSESELADLHQTSEWLSQSAFGLIEADSSGEAGHDGATSPGSVEPDHGRGRTGSHCYPAPSASGCPSLAELLFHFASVTAKAKVDISAFEADRSECIFSNNYIQPIVPREDIDPVEDEKKELNDVNPKSSGTVCEGRGKTASTGNDTRTSDKDCNEHVSRFTHKYRIYSLRYTSNGRTLIRPPYVFDALTAAAIFLSRSRELSRPDIVSRISDMFEMFQDQDSQWQITWRKKVMKRSKRLTTMLYRRGQLYGLNYDQIDMNMFNKVNVFGERAETERFADDLFTELGVPEKRAELQQKVERARLSLQERSVETEGRDARTDTPSVPDTARGEDVAPKTAARAELPTPEPAHTNLSDADMRKTSLLLPPRPCFMDENSSDSIGSYHVTPTRLEETAEPVPSGHLPVLSTWSQPQVVTSVPTYAMYYLSSSAFGSFVTVPIGPVV